MYKTVLAVALIICSSMASPDPKPGVIAAAYTAPVVAAPVAPAVVTAQSSQVFARTYNGLVSPVVAAAPLVKAPFVGTPIVKAPVVGAPVAYASPYVASPYVASPYVASPYVAAPAPVFV